MPLLKDDHYTSKDYWSLPEGERAELIDGKFYAMAPPGRIHQEIVSGLHYLLRKYIADHHGFCRVYPAPFAVNLDADDKNWVEPDVSVICDSNKLTDRGCSGAPDLIFEVVSPSSRKLGYGIKNVIYFQAGVREYWVVDPVKERVTVYHYENDVAPMIYACHSAFHQIYLINFIFGNHGIVSGFCRSVFDSIIFYIENSSYYIFSVIIKIAVFFDMFVFRTF